MTIAPALRAQDQGTGGGADTADFHLESAQGKHFEARPMLSDLTTGLVMSTVLVTAFGTDVNHRSEK
jgi:hypothetical protein